MALNHFYPTLFFPLLCTEFNLSKSLFSCFLRPDTIRIIFGVIENRYLLCISKYFVNENSISKYSTNEYYSFAEIENNIYKYSLLIVHVKTSTMKNKRLIIILATAVALLLIPLIAMQFTNEVDWKLLDFVIMGFLLVGTGLMCELILRKFKKLEYRVLIIGAVLFMFFLIWAELAVGILGTPLAGS